MSTLWKPKGRRAWIVQWVEGRDRRSVTLGACDKRTAEAIRRELDDLIAARRGGVMPSGRTLDWIKSLSGPIRDRLMAYGMLGDVVQAPLTIEEAAEAYIDARASITDDTRRNLNYSLGSAVGYFGDGRTVNAISDADALKFYESLKGEYAAATAGKRFRDCRQFVGHAVKAGRVDRNPFASVRVASGNNRDRSAFVTPETAQAVLQALGSHEWRLAFALSRYGGLRVPSELRGLRWADVDGVNGTLRVASPKGEKDGKGSRLVPLFPELRDVVEDAHEAAADPTGYMLPELRSLTNLGVLFGKQLKAAGITPWPKVFHNGRASRITELRQRFDAASVEAWMGNTAAVQDLHYTMPSDESFQAAIGTASAVQRGHEKGRIPAGIRPIYYPARI